MLAESGEAVEDVGEGAGQAVGHRRGAGKGVGELGKAPGRASASSERAGLQTMATRAKSSRCRARAKPSAASSANGRSASQKPDKYRFARNVEGDGTVAERTYRTYAAEANEERGEDPDVPRSPSPPSRSTRSTCRWTTSNPTWP